MGAIAGKQHTVMDKALHAPALEGVNAVPLLGELHIRAEHGTHIALYILGFDAGSTVDIPAQLKVEAPHIVGLAVHQRGLTGVERWIKPEPALCRAFFMHADVSNEEVLLKHPAIKIQPHMAAHRRLAAIAGNQPVGLDAVAFFARSHLQLDMVIKLLHGLNVLAHAQAHIGQLEHGVQQRLFHVVLLNIDKARVLLVFDRQHVELVNRLGLLTPEDLAHVPGHALLQQLLTYAQAVKNIQRTLGKADRLGATSNELQLADDQYFVATAPQIKRHGQAHRAGTDDQYGHTLNRLGRRYRAGADMAPHGNATMVGSGLRSQPDIDVCCIGHGV